MPTTDQGSEPIRKSVIVAAPHGFCAGVVRAIDIVERLLEFHGPPIYVRKEIVHNRWVVDDLAKRGVVFVESESEVPAGQICVFSAHGVSPQVRTNARQRGLRVTDATCPLVSKVHAEAQRFARSDRTILLIGHAGHEEVEGTAGEAPGRTIVVESVADVDRLEISADTPVAYLTQTTLSLDDTRDVVAAVRRKFTDVRGPGSDDICYASQNRQVAVKQITAACDVVLVVGAYNSSNSNRLVEVSRQAGTPAYLVPDTTALDDRWLDGASTVGVTAGASTPEVLVNRLLASLAARGFVDVYVHRTVSEDVTFQLPASLEG